MANDVDVWVVGIEIGGTKLQLGIGRGQGDLVALERLHVDPSRHASGILDQICQAFPVLLHKADVDRSLVQAIGIGFGGPVDAELGVTQTSYQVAGWDDFPLAHWAVSHLEVPTVVVHNDSDTAGLAEARFGAGRGFSPLLYMNVGSGIGGALIIGDRIYRGFGQGAGEIGHLRVIDTSGPAARLDELELVASGWAIARAAQEHARKILQEGRGWIVLDRASGDRSRITTLLVAEAAQAGDAEAISILTRAHEAIAFALVQAITLVAPRRIVMGGGVSLIGEAGWLTPIRRLVERDVFPPFRGGFDIAPAALGEEVVVHGALALARDAVADRKC
ncbi:MAG: ROK family protein [Isosphaeraceae bacterium]